MGQKFLFTLLLLKTALDYDHWVAFNKTLIDQAFLNFMIDILQIAHALAEANILIDQIVFHIFMVFCKYSPFAEIGGEGLYRIGNHSAVESFLSIFVSSGAVFLVTFEFEELLKWEKLFFELLKFGVKHICDKNFSINLIIVHVTFSVRQAFR